MELIGFCQGNPYDPMTWRGSTREIFLALRNRGILQTTHDVEVKGLRRYIGALREYSPNKNVWRHNFNKSPSMFERRTHIASERLDQAGHVDAVLQIGAMFDATALHRNVPRYCYLDSNCMLSEEGGARSLGFYANKQYKQLAYVRERAIYHRSEGIFTVSQRLRQSLIQDFGMTADRVHVVHAGVNIAVPPIQMDREKEPIVLFVAADFAQGGDAILRAFAHVRQAVPHARLWVAAANAAAASGQANVDIFGPIDRTTPDGEERMAQLFRDAAIFAAPSPYEPFPMSYAEAMHFALPCVGIERHTVPEIVEDRKTGLLVPPEDPELFAGALIYLLQHTTVARTMGMEAKKRAEQLFRWETVATKMEFIMNRDKESKWLRVAS